MLIAALAVAVTGIGFGAVPPSSTELLAAYCLPIKDQMASFAGSGAGNSTLSDEMRDFFRKMQHDNQREAQRIRSYLVGQGYMTDRDPAPILLAFRNGQSDINDCQAAQDKKSAACSRLKRCDALASEIP